MFRSIFLAIFMAGAAAGPPGDDVPTEVVDEAPQIAPDIRSFITSNLIAILYHELGHAVIDIERLPIFGQEEDAADVLSILLVHDIFNEQSAVAIAYHTAHGFLTQAKDAEAKGYEEAWWDVHGTDRQRYFTLVCLFYGANPDEREDIARELGLPGARARTCEEEYELASESWGPVMDDLRKRGAGRSFRMIDRAGGTEIERLTHDVIAMEVVNLNADMSMDRDLDVIVESCGQANAFYDPNVPSIIMCTEFAEYLAEIYVATQ